MKKGHSASPVQAENLTEWTDEELMMAYQAGKEEAFRHLYERHSPKVYGFLSTRLNDRALADDIFQATFLKFHQSRDRYDPSFPFSPWLFTVCRSVMLDALRARQRVNRSEELNPVEVENAASEGTEESSVIPDLNLLPAGQRQVLEMRYLEDLSFDEIAHRLETTSANSRQLVSRAVKALRKVVQGGKKK